MTRDDAPVRPAHVKKVVKLDQSKWNQQIYGIYVGQ